MAYNPLDIPAVKDPIKQEWGETTSLNFVNHNTRIGDLESDSTSYDGRIDTLEAADIVHESDIVDLQNEDISLDGRIDTLESADALPANPNDATLFLSGADPMAWDTPTDTTYNVFNGTEDGLVPDPGTPSGKILSDNGTWTIVTGADGNDAIAITAADTSPGYLDSKVSVVAPIVKAVTSAGANEGLQFSLNLPADYTKYLDGDGLWSVPPGGSSGSGTYDIGDTTSSLTGILMKDSIPFLHNFHHPTGDTAIPNGDNIFLGENAGNFTLGSTATVAIHASRNMAIGSDCLTSITIGNMNLAIGIGVLDALTSGIWNLGIGDTALNANTGNYNIAIGVNSMSVGTNASNNTCVGHSTMPDSIGGYNSIFGGSSFQNVDDGDYNVAFGNGAAQASSIGGTITDINDGVFIGANSRPDGAISTNEIAIGKDCYGNGSNTATIGNGSIADTYLNGDIHGIVTAIESFTTNSTTPSVADGISFKTDNNTSVKTITAFTGGSAGQIFMVRCADAFTAIHGGLTKTGRLIPLEVGDYLIFNYDGTSYNQIGGTVGMGSAIVRVTSDAIADWPISSTTAWTSVDVSDDSVRKGANSVILQIELGSSSTNIAMYSRGGDILNEQTTYYGTVSLREEMSVQLDDDATFEMKFTNFSATETLNTGAVVGYTI